MTDESRDVTLESIIDLVVDLVLDRVRGFEVARVTSYDDVRQSASIQSVVRRASVAESGARAVDPPTEVHDVPVAFPGSSGGRVTIPVRPGDYGLVIYSSVAIDRWKMGGGVVDPGDDRRHDPSDCVFVPGIHSLNAPPTTAPTDAVVIHGLQGSKVRIGGPTGTQKTFMADNFLGALDALLDAIQAAVGTITGGAAAAAAIGTAIAVFKAGPLRAAYQTDVTEVK